MQRPYWIGPPLISSAEQTQQRLGDINCKMESSHDLQVEAITAHPGKPKSRRNQSVLKITCGMMDSNDFLQSYCLLMSGETVLA
jgi:hypothetical protein